MMTKSKHMALELMLQVVFTNKDCVGQCTSTVC